MNKCSIAEATDSADDTDQIFSNGKNQIRDISTIRGFRDSALFILNLSTIYHLPSTFYHLPSTFYLLPSTFYLLPSTFYNPGCRSSKSVAS